MLRKNTLQHQSEALFFRKLCFFNYFWRMVNIIQKKCMCIVLLHVKLQLQRIKTVKMREKSIQPLEIHCFPPILLHPKFLTHEYNFWTPPDYLLCRITLATHEQMNKTVPSSNGLELRGVRGMNLNKF